MNNPLIISKIFKNKIVFYLSSRYITYFVQFFTSLLIAAKLGPYYLGIWGFILLLLNYFQQFHFGISNSFNVLYVQNIDNKEECNNYIWNSLVLIGYVSIMIVIWGLYEYLIEFKSIEKYHAHNYTILICIIAILQYYVQFFMNLFRVRNMLYHVAFCQSIIVILCFIFVFVFEGEKLINSLVLAYLIGNLICVVLACFTSGIPKLSDIRITKDYQLLILKKGLFLFLYNACFYFIIISIRTIISNNYTVEEFGLFTFSFTVANSVMLTLEALSFVVFPKVLKKLSADDNKAVFSTLEKIRAIYMTSAHFLIYFVLLCFPLLLYFLSDYKSSLMSMHLIALTVLMNSCAYGYTDLLVAHNKEKRCAQISLTALLTNVLLALLFSNVFHFGYQYIIIATMISYLGYSIMAAYYSKEYLEKGSFRWANLYKEVFPIKLMVPFIIALMISLLKFDYFVFAPLVVFMILNRKDIVEIIKISKTMIKQPNIVDV